MLLSAAIFFSTSSPLPDTTHSQGFRFAVPCSSKNHTFPKIPAGGASPVSFITATAPWMAPPNGEAATPIPTTRTVRNHRKGRKFSRKLDRSLRDKVRGVRVKKVVDRIAERINTLRETVPPVVGVENGEVGFDLGLADDEGEVVGSGRKGMMPWVKGDGKEGSLWEETGRRRRKRMASGEELGIEEGLLRRLRSEAARMRDWVKVMKIGVLEEVVGEIRQIWRRGELAMVKFNMPLCQNMDRTQEILEMKTGGLVVWRKKDVLFMYRGSDYSLRNLSRKAYNASEVCPNLNADSGLLKDHTEETKEVVEKEEDATFLGEIGSFEPINRSLYERETDRLLDGRGSPFP